MRYFSKRLTAKSIYFIIFLIAGITLSALVILSYLLTQESIKNNEEFTRKSFLSKYEIVQFEFNRIVQEQKMVHHILENETSNWAQKQEQLKTINQIQLQHRLPIQHWWKNKLEFKHNIYTEQNALKWRLYDSLRLEDGQIIYYGFDLNLFDLHQYFAEINQNSQNYVFVFDKDGICITHPDEKFIGKNVFDFTSIQPQDTMITNKTFAFSEHKAISEFLTNTAITRFIKPLQIPGFDGYVAVAHLDFIVDENVRPTQRYVLIIFAVTIFLVSIILIFFNVVTRQADKEKQTILNEKNALLISHEKMVKENALNQLEQLKNQIQPHFLFNSLNTLYMIISMDPKRAQRFTMNLARIYRYLIVPPKDHLVKVEKELDFIRYYLAIQQDRFQEELSFEINIQDQELLQKKIPYLALQLVIENAIKHNIATVAQPLEILIEGNGNQIIVTNTYQPLQYSENNVQFGTEYLNEFYRFFGEEAFQNKIVNGKFICILPLLE